jgi:predicted amidophosphoribosyltransferase
MGLFEKAGRRFEELKREAASAAAEHAGYECEACGKKLHKSPNYCPECGADAVVPVGDDESEKRDDADATDVGDADDRESGD